jgi:hypothetical protein
MAQKAVKHKMRYSQKHGKMVKVDPKRSSAIMRGKKKKRKMSAAHKAAIGKAVRLAFKRKKNKYGHPVRKWGRPSTGKKKVKKEGTGKKRGRPPGSGKKTEEPKKRGRPKKVEAPKRGRPAGSKNKPKAEAPKRGRPRKGGSEMKFAVIKKRGMRAA